MKTLTIPSLDALPQAAREFINSLGDRTVVTFKGEMGAGKTTFINELCRQLGVETDATSSPTFALVNEYRSDTTAELIYHFDLYRLEDLDEAMDMGIEDYLDCGALCLIEWPDVIDPILPTDVVEAALTVNPDGSRTLTWD
ncbi:MAG: tRNA (adenosine(37)-N6)-threonylcarbamoyltransferase complex ATPase subunit type 1 TsaE [Bacteroides sp.]|nr:tRNA (adenosine(37)-N6)-threonylcarbamoyltransferase complex ATPase subunit type 1 TsaE [Bacteroides sp.]MBD5362226.1 tRNA (adenosine(37)-N6)-threonylcarbamoyltransferase complex ATPase subunit type 1 TsaE [Bacteroides sp.]MBD5364004.1 tRNA (adenosine(37)-N6)-threonylcarbamoyltransferase complex ATPase subunit type 1 TsaE [Bacteroides sp.]MBD5372508.1 tRNA (adenosine(37)-N6)-threonylcarbamoyltransferase complex ATPase subunit type 1 TsaE [Bacteroides sp.]